MLSHFSRVRLCATPQTAAHQASPSLGFSRQEHWNGLPFPSPMHESEKWKWSHSVVSDSVQPHGLPPTRLLRPWDFPGKSTGVGCHCLLQLNKQGDNIQPWRTPFPSWNQSVVPCVHLGKKKNNKPTYPQIYPLFWPFPISKCKYPTNFLPDIYDKQASQS